jgi:hypothetical protein
MKHLILILLLISNYSYGQDNTPYDPPKFEFEGTPIKWSHRISDPYIDTLFEVGVIRNRDQIATTVEPLIINGKYIAIYYNNFFGLIVECYDMGSGNICWRQSFNRTTNEDRRGTSCIYAEADGDEHIILTCFQSASVGGFSTTSFGGLINKRKLSIATGEQVDYLYNDVFSERILNNRSIPMHDIKNQDLIFFYMCGSVPFGTPNISGMCIPSYISKSTLRRQNPLVVPDTIVFNHLDEDGFGPGYAVFGPFVENEENYVYMVEYFWDDQWRHEMWKVDDYGNVRWRRDITSKMATPSDAKNLVYPQNSITVENDKMRILASHSNTENPIGHIGYIEMDFEGNVTKNNAGMIIDGKKAGRMKTIRLKGSNDLLHCIRFQSDNNIYFYKEKPDGSYLKAGELINQNSALFAFLPQYMIQSENGDLYIQFSSLLDSVYANQNFVLGGWLYVSMIEADQLDIRVNTEDFYSIAFTITPNPTSDLITITIAEGAASGSIQITDQTGRIVTTQDISTSQTTIDISALPSGLYFVSLTDRKGKRVGQMQKLVKM